MAAKKAVKPPSKEMQALMARAQRVAEAKKAAIKKMPLKQTMPRESVKVSSSVRVVGRNGNVVNEKLTSGANQAKVQNARAAKTEANKKALKAANKTPKNKSTGVTRGSLYAARPGYTGSSSGKVGINYLK